MGPRCVLGDNSAAHSYLQLLTSGYLHKPLAPLLPAPLIPETMGPHAGSGFSCRSVGWALGVKPEAERGTSGTGEDLKGWAPPRFGSLWEERGASGQAPTGASEQMAEGIIKIQLCSHRRLGLTEEEAAGSRVGVGVVPPDGRGWVPGSQESFKHIGDLKFPFQGIALIVYAQCFLQG